jgi:hypothetical protein
MVKLFEWLLDWSEAWAPLIPLTCLFFNRNQPSYLKPVIFYLVFAFFINTCGDIIGDYKQHFPDWLQSNNLGYNAHSIVRFICFASFFLRLRQTSFTTARKIIPIVSLLVIIINFGFVEDIFNTDYLSGNLLTAEAYLLLIYCLLYYLSKLGDEEDSIASGPDFWVVTGLSIYVVVNFFVFLFYVPMIKLAYSMADHVWNVHNVAYILLCIFITKAFYASGRHQYAI